MSGRPAHAAALTNHSFDEVLGKLPGFQKGQRRHAGFSAGTGTELDIRCVFSSFPHTFHYGVGYTAGACEAFSPKRSFLIAFHFRLQLNAFRTEKRGEFTKGKNVVGISADAHLLRFGFFRHAGADEDGYAVGMNCFQVAGNRRHGRERLRHIVVVLLREVLL